LISQENINEILSHLHVLKKFPLLFNFQRASAQKRVPSRSGLVYYIKTFFVCQYLFSSFFIFLEKTLCLSKAKQKKYRVASHKKEEI